MLQGKIQVGYSSTAENAAARKAFLVSLCCFLELILVVFLQVMGKEASGDFAAKQQKYQQQQPLHYTRYFLRWLMERKKQCYVETI